MGLNFSEIINIYTSVHGFKIIDMQFSLFDMIYHLKIHDMERNLIFYEELEFPLQHPHEYLGDLEAMRLREHKIIENFEPKKISHPLILEHKP